MGIFSFPPLSSVIYSLFPFFPLPSPPQSSSPARPAESDRQIHCYIHITRRQSNVYHANDTAGGGVLDRDQSPASGVDGGEK